MAAPHSARRLDQLETPWNDVSLAHDPSPEVRRAAQGRLVVHYEPTIRRYLHASLSDRDGVDDVFQQWAVRLSAGAFRRADPARGSFGRLIKTSLRNLVVDHMRRQKRCPVQLAPGHDDPVYEETVVLESDRVGCLDLRVLLLYCAEKQLAADDLATGQHLATLWALYRAHPFLPSEQLAMKYSARVGHRHSPRWVRKWLPLTREQLADAVLESLETALERPTPANMEAKVIELTLLPFCRNVLARRAARAKMCC